MQALHDDHTPFLRGKLCQIGPFLCPLLLFGMVFLNPGINAADSQSRRPSNETDLRFWLENMLIHHRFSLSETSAATGLSNQEIKEHAIFRQLDKEKERTRPANAPLLVLPYPGGRHPRIGFLEGAINPQRETKISVFAPWDAHGYAVLDIPEAIWSNLGLTYLAHTHIDTVWDSRGITLKPLEWTRHADGSLTMDRTLPNGIAFGTEVIPMGDHLRMKMWLHNGTDQNLSDMRVQHCVMLKGLPGFDQITNENKLFMDPYMACRSEDGRRWAITAWTPNHRTWANAPCPCMHSDPKFPDCKPDEQQVLQGWFSFYEGVDIVGEIQRIQELGWNR